MLKIKDYYKNYHPRISFSFIKPLLFHFRENFLVYPLYRIFAA